MMSHQYRYRKNSRSGGDATFPIVILLAGVAWNHQELMLKVEHMAIRGLVIGLAILGMVMAYRAFRRIRAWTLRHIPSIAVIDSMTGFEFERYVAKLLKTRGYNHIRLTEEYDYGVDIIAVKGGITWGIQVKRYSGLVKAEAVRQVVTALRMYHYDRAMVITNSNFSHPAITLADSNDCILVDGQVLRTWVD